MDSMKKWTAEDSPLRDPVRFVLMQTLCRRGRIVMLALLTAVYGLLLGKLCSAMQGAAVIAAVGAAGAAVLMAFFFGALGRSEADGRVRVIVLLCTAALSMLAVGAHIALLDIKPGRYANVLDPMLYEMWNYDLLSAMAWEEGSWSGFYLIICALFSRLETFSALYAFKLFDLACQCLAAGAVLRLALQRGAKAGAAVAAALACVLAPTMLMNAGVWAQCDATFAMFTLWGLAMLLDDHPLAGCVLWGFALGTKLQSAFLFPLLIVMFMNRKVALRHILALCATALLCNAAILLDGQGLMGVVTRYAAQLDAARWGDVGLADHAPGVYSLMVVASVREFSGMGLYLGIASALLVVMAMLYTKAPLTKRTYMLAALLLACGLPLILPQMNARSLYLAGMLAFACADNRRLLAAAGLMEFVSLCSYMEAVFSSPVMPMMILSMLAIAAAVLVLSALYPQLCPKNDAEAKEEQGA